MTNADHERFLKLAEVVDRINTNVETLNTAVLAINKRINDLEEKLYLYKSHDHPYKHPPIYGGGSL